jgi:hypothetical protein
MRASRFGVLIFGIAAFVAGGVAGKAQSLPLAPTLDAGLAVVAVFEGWFSNPDGSYSLLYGYFNRNQREELDIPIGPNNRIEPGGPDRGQPTHFLTGRQYGMFSVRVPKDFGTGKISWTLISNGYTSAIPASLNPDYEVSPFIEAAVGNTPPVLSFEEKGGTAQGPVGLNTRLETTVGRPLTLTVWVSDDGKRTSGSGALSKNPGPPVTLRWDKYRGPGNVKFSEVRPKVDFSKAASEKPGFSGQAATTATFSEPGEYVLHVVANDYSGDGGGGFQCCWTFGTVDVSVRP